MTEAWGRGLATLTGEGRVLDVLFPDPRLGAGEGAPGTSVGEVRSEDPRRGVKDVEVVKALELSGADGLLFRRNSQTGAVEAMPRSGAWAGLNAALHAND